MSREIRQTQAGFTLVEIMIVVAIIGLIATLALPSFLKARKQSQGRRIVQDCRQMDAAIDQWAFEMNKTDGATIDTNSAASYVKPLDWRVNDVLGNPWTVNTVGTNQIMISTTTKSSLAGVGIDWGAY